MSAARPVSRGRKASVERLLPLAYLVLAALLVLAVLPSVLRTQSPQQSQTAQLDPNAPPDHSQQIIASVNQASSGTAGSGQGTSPPGVGNGPDGQAAAPGGPPPPPPPAAIGCHGFGDPPRQVESLYSAPCMPPCAKNEGATWHNVTGDEVRVGFRHNTAALSYSGPVPSTPPASGESAADRTARVIQAYFNQRFQTCGRRIQLWALGSETDSSTDTATQRAGAATADANHLFAVYALGSAFCDEIVRRQLIASCNPQPASFYRQGHGLRWGWMSDFTKTDQLAAELLCKQLKPNVTEFTDPPLKDKPRVFGAMYRSSQNSGSSHTTADLKAAFSSGCGGTFADTTEFSAESESDDYSRAQAAVAKYKADGVSTIVLVQNSTMAAVIMSIASADNYYPEWVFPSPYGLDFNFVGSVLPPDQMKHAFGFSQFEIPRPLAQTDCYTAYKSIDPANAPDANVCNLIFPPVLQIVNGIQMAGPKLTPDTFREGLFKLGHRFYPDKFSVGGGYGPDDYTYIDDFGLVWWDSTGTDPATGDAGAYKWMNGGHRYQLGQIPTAPQPWFKSGSVQG